jgi:hypothetical protein
MEKFKDVLAWMGVVLLFFSISVLIVLLILNAPQVALTIIITLGVFVVVSYMIWSFCRIFGDKEYGGEE